MIPPPPLLTHPEIRSSKKYEGNVRTLKDAVLVGRPATALFQSGNTMRHLTDPHSHHGTPILGVSSIGPNFLSSAILGIVILWLMDTNPSPELQRLLTVEETLRTLRISRTTLWRRLHDRQIECVRIGSRVLFEPQAIRAFIAKLRQAN